MPKTVVAELPDELKRKFDVLLSKMSPENVSCDGELSPEETARDLARLRKEWRKLEKAAGRKVSEEEAWGFFVELKLKEGELKSKKAIAEDTLGLAKKLKDHGGAVGEIGAVAEMLFGEGYFGNK